MKLALGTVQFGLDYGVANRTGRASLHETREIVERARAMGMDTLDTAIDYGESERRLGEIGVQGWRVVTKLPAVPDDCSDLSKWAFDSLHGSLRRLRTGAVYAVLLHRPHQLLEPRGSALYEALCSLRRERSTQKIGVSVYGPEELDALTADYDFDIVQAPFNVLDRRLADSGWLAKLEERGVELHTRSAFLQGLLLMSSADRPAKFSRWAGIWQAWEQWLAETELSAAAACLRYVTAFPEIDRVVVGVDTLSQLGEIARCVDGSLPPLPDGVRSRDPDLLNPARWAQLTTN